MRRWIWWQTQQGEKVEIWTVCAGNPPEGPLSPYAQTLHQRWQTGPEAVAVRRQEDQEACQRIGALPRYFSIPDCIYRYDPERVPQLSIEMRISSNPHSPLPNALGLTCCARNSKPQYPTQIS